jgi:hypothetical protein
MAEVADFQALDVHCVLVVQLAWIVQLEVQHGTDLVHSYSVALLQAALPTGCVQVPVQT